MIFIEFSRIKRSWCKITFLNHFIYVGHSMWNQPTLPTWPTWILLIFCQVSVHIKKWKSWKFHLLIMKGFKIMTTWIMNPLAWTTKYYNLWHFETALIQPVLIVNIWNFEWGLIFWKYLLQKIYLVKFWKLHLWWSTEVVKLTTSVFFSHFQWAITS